MKVKVGTVVHIMFTRFSPVVRASLVRTVQRYASTASGEHNLILGCGSNVMDLFFRVRKLPAPGEKQYFAGTQALSASVVGGTFIYPIVLRCLSRMIWAVAWVGVCRRDIEPSRVGGSAWCQNWLASVARRRRVWQVYSQYYVGNGREPTVREAWV